MEDHYVKVFAQEILQGFTEDNMFILMMADPVNMRQVPILMGKHEIEMIMLENSQRQLMRPMTHQLVLSLCNTFHLELQKVTIDRYYEGIFYATLHVSDGVSVRKIDSRSSDAIALALHENIDIWMHESILQETGSEITFDNDGQQSATPQADELSLAELEEQLHQCETNEDYEKAAELNRRIEALKKSMGN